MSLEKIIHAARGKAEADLLLANARLVNVFTGTVDTTAIAVAGGRVVGFGDYRARRRIDLDGRYVAPGLIDAHVHIESAMVAPGEFARAVLPFGTTAVVADPHEIANVLGTAGIDYMLAAAGDQPMRFYFALSSCVPATAMETAGARLEADDLKRFYKNPRVVALAEMMNYPGVLEADPAILEKIADSRAHGRVIDGHAPGLSGRDLYAYLAAGIGSDHECTTVEEAREKLAAGMHIMVRQGTGARNLDALLPLIGPHTARRMMWCTDDRHPHDLLADGHIDSIVRQAVAAGVDPVIAIQMATLNPAEYFGLGQVGAVAPGRRADMVVFDDLQRLTVEQVYVGGELVAENGKVHRQAIFPAVQVPASAMHLDPDRIDFQIPAAGRRVRVIELIPDQIVTRARVCDAPVQAGQVVADISRDLLKMAVIERHRGSGRTGLGMVRGFGLQRGALAATVAHDSHNLIVAGVNDEDMRLAARCLAELGGGFAVAAGGRVLAQLALPIAGLMSDQPVATVRDQLDAITGAAKSLGAVPADPFMILGFLALPVIPELKLTDQGLVDVTVFAPVPLFVN